MTLEEIQELRKVLKNQGIRIITSNSWGKHEWVAHMKYKDEYIKVIDCSYRDMTTIKYRIKFVKEEDSSYFSSDEWVYKSIKNCTAEEVLLSIKRLKIQIKEEKMVEKLKRIEKDFT